MATTVKKIINKALQKSGVLFKSETPDSDEANDALDALNAMLSSWSNDSMLIYARAWETFNLQGGINSYTIGLGQTFDTVRPIDIIAATCTISLTDEEVDVVDDTIFNTQIAVKSAPGFPSLINFDNGYPTATIRVWPVPNTNYPLFLLSEKLLSQFGINDNLDLPPGWERALIYNLAIEIASDYGQEPSQSTVMIAKESKGLIRKAINRNRNLDASPKMRDRGNIYSGWWNR